MFCSHYRKNALQPRFEQQLELPQLTIQFSLAELLFAAYVGASWFQSNPCPSRFLDLSVMDDVFSRAGGEYVILIGSVVLDRLFQIRPDPDLRITE